jgi:hypothetical protein
MSLEAKTLASDIRFSLVGNNHEARADWEQNNKEHWQLSIRELRQK